MKLFKTGSIEIVKQSQEYFDLEIPSVLWTKRVSKFESKLTTLTTCFVNIWYNRACLLMILCHSVMLVLFIMFVCCYHYVVNKDEYIKVTIL